MDSCENREIENQKSSFDFLEDRPKISVGNIKTSRNLVFDDRIVLKSKSRWVKDGHRTAEPEWSNLSGDVSREYSCCVDSCCSERPTYLCL